MPCIKNMVGHPEASPLKFACVATKGGARPGGKFNHVDVTNLS